LKLNFEFSVQTFIFLQNCAGDSYRLCRYFAASRYQLLQFLPLLSPGTIVSRKRVSLILLVLVYHMKSRYGSLLIFSDSPYIYAHFRAEKLWFFCQHSVGRIELGIIGTYMSMQKNYGTSVSIP